MAAALLRPMSKGELLDGAFTIYRKNFLLFVAVGLILVAPQLVLDQVSPGLGGFVSWLFGAALTASMIWMAAEATLGRTPKIGAALGVGFRRFFPIIVSSFLVGLLIGLGFLFLIVPGILLSIMAFALHPVVVLEGEWVGFSRSAKLAKGVWGHIAILSIIAWLIVLLPTIGVAVITMLVNGSTPGTTASDQAAFLHSLTLVANISVVFIAPFSHSLTTLMYFDQRVRKEGFGIEAQAAALGGAGATARP